MKYFGLKWPIMPFTGYNQPFPLTWYWLLRYRIGQNRFPYLRTWLVVLGWVFLFVCLFVSLFVCLFVCFWRADMETLNYGKSKNSKYHIFPCIWPPIYKTTPSFDPCRRRSSSPWAATWLRLCLLLLPPPDHLLQRQDSSPFIYLNSQKLSTLVVTEALTCN